MAEESKVVAKNISATPNPNQMLTYIILGLIALIIILLLGAMYIIFYFKFPKPVYQTVGPGTTTTQVINGNTSDQFGELVSLNELVVSLGTTTTGSDYLRISVTLEVPADEKIKAEIEKRVPQFQDLILSIGNSMTAAELNKIEGKNKFRSEILRQINNIVGPGKVKSIFFTQYVLFVQ